MKPKVSSAKGVETYVALLRGVNVGGKNIVPMRELVAIFEGAGCTEVSTYIQSGNVVLNAKSRIAGGLTKVIGRGIAEQFGCTIAVVLRTAVELRAIARSNPFIDRGASADALHLVFLADEPSARAVAALDSGQSLPDEFVVRGREIYLRCPNGMGRTKLTNDYFDRKLATTSTVRNWRTVEKLVAMTAGGH